MEWVKCENPDKVRGKYYQRIINLDDGRSIYIQIYTEQPASDLNLSVWITYIGDTTYRLFMGTEVECIRIIDRFSEKFNAQVLDAWD